MNELKIKKLEKLHNKLIGNTILKNEFMDKMLILFGEFKNIQRKERMIEGKIKHLKNKDYEYTFAELFNIKE